MKKPILHDLSDYYKRLVEINGKDKVLEYLDSIIEKQEGRAKEFYTNIKTELTNETTL